MQPGEAAAAEVEGEMLMVIVTVVMAAVIAAAIFGVVQSISPTKITAIIVDRNESDYLILTNYGGKDIESLESLYVLGDVTPGPVAITELGQRAALKLTSKNARVMVIGNFTDNTTQVLLDTNV